MRTSSRRSGVPLYHIICLVLRDGIDSGRYKSGAALPTEDDLARDYNVSRVTVRRALGELANAGLIERRQGSGTFVRARPTANGKPLGLIASTISQIDTLSERTTARIIEFEYIETPPEINAAFGRHSSERMQRAVRLREADGESLMYITTWTPEKLGRAYDSADMERESINHLLARSGVRPTSGEQIVSVTMADPAVARLMRLDVGAPMLKVIRLMRDQRRRTVQYVEMLARADRFTIRMKLGA
ncbi:GntR family transcriptional regulator [Reyranella sp. CPCC 100927]|uniref:GntR family transcriptional regulator n=1 Tax=Reyranella sp. CPCC 100927 TaxID=2599616 RepID=UPI0015B7378F|nr:GntR family transcriptional regulator [Reyranella sp. CPCC 100927]